ncbi:subtilisin family serine protease [Bradyrhizobium diazoefficiens]
MAQFIVLKNAKSTGTRSPFEEFGPTTESVPAAPEPRVEVLNVTPADAHSIAQDQQVTAVAIPMPIALIKPCETDLPAGIAAATDAWGISAIGADRSPFTGDGVVVAVLDTGIDKSHPAFAGVDIIEKDFSGSGDGDRNGHGTHCAATIIGRDVNGKRIGIARGVRKALIGKVLADNGGGNSDMIFRGIQWALEQGAHVISMSLGFDFPGAVQRMVTGGMPISPATSNALEAYRSNLRFFDALTQMIEAKGAFGDTAVVVAATGNESVRPTFTVAASLPAASRGIISVAALGRNLAGKFEVAKFSNTMSQLAAPGVDILSAKAGGGLASMSGTSMACPHVAGIAALWWEALRKSGTVKASASLVATKLLGTARTDGLSDGPLDRGTGIVTAPQ